MDLLCGFVIGHVAWIWLRRETHWICCVNVVVRKIGFVAWMVWICCTDFAVSRKMLICCMVFCCVETNAWLFWIIADFVVSRKMVDLLHGLLLRREKLTFGVNVEFIVWLENALICCVDVVWKKLDLLRGCFLDLLHGFCRKNVDCCMNSLRRKKNWICCVTFGASMLDLLCGLASQKRIGFVAWMLCGKNLICCVDVLDLLHGFCRKKC